MPGTAAIDPVLKRFRETLAELDGPAPARVLLFDSHARGDSREDSDYDIAVFLKNPDEFRTKWEADLRIRFLDAGGPFVEAIPFRASDYHKRAPLMHEIRKDGLPL